MSRRRTLSIGPHAVRASGDRWLFGYADVVTLLLKDPRTGQFKERTRRHGPHADGNYVGELNLP